jgi:hypothetical protein
VLVLAVPAPVQGADGDPRFKDVLVEAVCGEPHPLPLPLLRPVPFIFSFLLVPPMLLILSFFFSRRHEEGRFVAVLTLKQGTVQRAV